MPIMSNECSTMQLRVEFEQAYVSTMVPDPAAERLDPFIRWMVKWCRLARKADSPQEK